MSFLYFNFHNWGQKAGASIYHPHYQIIATPLFLLKFLIRLKVLLIFQKKKMRSFEMIKWEKNRLAIVYENKGVVVLSPFAPAAPYELRVFPKKHLPYFEDTNNKDLEFIVDALQKSLAKIEKTKDRITIFIHTSPLKNKKKHKYYHWHIEILPKIEIPGALNIQPV